MQRTSLDERLGIKRHIVAFVDEHRKPDSRDGSEPGIAEDCRNAEVFVVHDASNQVEHLLLEHIEWRLFGLLRWHRNRRNGLRQGTLVDLLILVERYGIDLHRDSRHHVWRLLFKDEVVEGFDVYLLVADDVCSNELAGSFAFHVEGLHRGILDAGELADDGLDLLQLDAEAANLHLPVPAANELDVTIGQVAHDVACLIDAVVLGFVGKRVADIHFSRLLGTVQIATRHLRTCHPQLAACSYRQAEALLVHDIELAVLDGFSDRDVLLLLLYPIVGDVANRFRRAIAVGEAERRGRREGRQLLASRHQHLQGVVLDAGGKLVGHLCRHERMSDAIRLEVIAESNQVESHLLGYDVEFCPNRQRGEYFHGRGVEAKAGISCHTTLGVDIIGKLMHVAERYPIPVLRHATLGHAGRAAGIY